MRFPPPTERQAHVIWFAVTTLAVALVTAALGVLAWGLGKVLAILAPVLWPLAVAAVIAYLLDPLVDWIEKRKVPRARAIILVFIVALAVVAGVFSSVIPQVVVETRQLIDKVPDYTTRIHQKAEQWIAHPPDLLLRFLPLKKEAASSTNATQTAEGTTNNLVASTNEVAQSRTTTPAAGSQQPDWSSAFGRETINSVTNWLTSILPQVGRWLFGQVTKVASWFGVLAGLALIPVYAFFLLLEKKGIASSWTDYLPVQKSSFKEELVFVLRSINDYLIAFFRGQVLVAICDSILYTIGFLAMGLNYAFLLGFIAIFLTIIPFLGAIIIFVSAVVLAFVQYGDWLHPALVVAVFAVVQTLESLVISPKIMGDKVGLHPLTIIIAVMAGTTLMGGILGGILAIPLTAALRVIMFRYIWKKRVPTPE